MSRLSVERPPVYRGSSKIPKFNQKSDLLTPVAMQPNNNRNMSKLQQLQSDYQQKLIREKEEKLIRMYEENQTRALQKVNSQSKMSVRDFLRERRQMEQSVSNAHQMPSINTHYKMKKMDSQNNDSWVHRQNSNGSITYSKNARGRDKSNPLAPIERNNGQSSAIPAPIPRKPQRHGRPWTYKESVDSEFSTQNGRQALNGIPKSAPLHNIQSGSKYTNGNHSPSDDTPPPNLSHLKQKQRSQQQSPVKKSPAPPSSNRQPKKMSDFQKWQIEQDQARQERLKKANVIPAYEYEETDDEEDVEEDDHIAEQQRELMARIEQQQRELERIRKQREQEEVQERKEKERRKKREEERRRRIKQEEEQRRREENERRMKEEEELERRIAEQSAASDYRMDSYRSTSQKPRNYSPMESEEDEGFQFKTQPTPPPHPKPVRVQRKTAPVRAPPPLRESSPPLPSAGKQDLSMFLQAANDPEAHGGGSVKLVACSNCGRKFAADRIQKHRNACGNITKKRKTYDPTKMRVAGTEMEQFYNSSKKQKAQPTKKSNWRNKHENFIQTIRYAKKAAEIEKTGGSIANLPPPPPSDTSDYVQCPWCSRKFNSTAAERHIPRCKDIKTRPPPMKRR